MSLRGHAAVNKRTSLQFLSSAGIVAVAIATSGCADQPPIRCGMASGPAMGLYQRMGEPKDVKAGACAALEAAGNALPVRGQDLTTEEYLPNQEGPASDTQRRSMAIELLWLVDRIIDAKVWASADPALQAQSAELANYPYTTANPSPALPPDDEKNTNRPYAWGFFDGFYPDSNGVCTATLNASDMTYPAVPAHSYIDPEDEDHMAVIDVDPVDATHVKYEFKEVKNVIQGASVGQQAFAELTMERDDCQATYHVSILSPLVTCESAELDDKGRHKADPGQCSSEAVANVADPTPQQLYGSGLPAGVEFKCEDMNEGDPADMDYAPEWKCIPTRQNP